MKLAITICLILLLAQASTAQHSANARVGAQVQRLFNDGVPFSDRALLSPAAEGSRAPSVVPNAMSLEHDPIALRRLLDERPRYITLRLPYHDRDLELWLYAVDPFADGGQVIVASSNEAIDVDRGSHYRGVVDGAPGSVVAISIFSDEVMGTIALADGTYTLGRGGPHRSGHHLLYEVGDHHAPPVMECHTADDAGSYTAEQLTRPGARSDRCVQYFWEVDHAVVVDKGGVAETAEFITGLFHQSATLFDNDGMEIRLSELFIWDVPSPYTGLSAQSMLDQFGMHRTTFNGDLAHLLGYAGGGGVAHFNGSCSSSIESRMAYSGITANYLEVPSYSWSVQVVTHEQGHQLGSRHTHACAWNGNDTPIDGCGQVAGHAEGDCATGPLPDSQTGGTIMSYCHLTSSTVKFSNGFGEQPSAVMLNTIENASCFFACAPLACGAPAAPAVSDLTPNSALVAWPQVEGAVDYQLQYRPMNDGAWSTIGGIVSTELMLTDLVGGGSYEVRVHANCAAGSACSNSTYFNTTQLLLDVPDGSEHARVTLFPNPATDLLVVELASMGHVELTIRDMAGRTVHEQHGSDAVVRVDVGAFSQGTYVVHTRTSAGGSVHRFVIRR